jgi:hypothetical protein
MARDPRERAVTRRRSGAVTLEVRGEARSRRYRISRPDRRHALLVREAAGGGGIELIRTEGQSVDWVPLAGAILTDVLGERPPSKLARDLARFIVTPPGQTRSMSGEEVDAWLATWQPPLATLFPKRWRGGAEQ